MSTPRVTRARTTIGVVVIAALFLTGCSTAVDDTTPDLRVPIEITPAAAVKQLGLEQVSDDSAIQDLARQVIDENPVQADQFRNGKEAVLGFLVGQLMKKSKGKANPKLAGDTLRTLLKQ